MKRKFLLGALLIGSAFAAWADGYTDGIEYYKAGQYNNARTVLNRTLNDAGTNKALSYYYLGSIDLINKDLAAAKANFDKGIAADANCPYNYVGLGAIDLRNGNAKAAEEQFKTAQKLDKKNYEILVNIARAYYNADPVKFASQVTKFLEKAHKDSKEKEPEIFMLEGDMLFDSKDLGGAAGKYEQAIRADQDNPAAYVKFATSYIGVNPEYTLQMLNELLSKQPNSALAQRELAERYYEVNQWSKAADQYGKYMSNPNHFPEDKARYLVLIYASADYPKAIQIADEILANDPNNAQALRVKMLAQKENKDYAGAKATAERFFAIPVTNGEAPFNANDYANYGQILEELDDEAGAVVQYQKAIDADPSRGENYKRLSLAYTRNKDYQKGAEIYEQWMQSNPDDVTLNDYWTVSGRWLNATSNAADPEAAYANAEKGIKAVDEVISRADQVSPSYLQRRALLMLLGDNKQVTPRVGEAFLQLVEALDADPANADPNNPDNNLKMYKQAYLMLTSHYMNQNDSAKAKEMNEKYEAIPE